MLAPFRLIPHAPAKAPRPLTLLVLVLLIAALLGAAPSHAQAKKAPPAAGKAAAKAKKHTAKKAPVKKAHAKKSTKKSANKSKKVSGKKAPALATARAPKLPRREPMTLTAKDRAVFAEAMKAVSSRSWSRALEAVDGTRNPVLRKVVQWAYIREPGPHASFAERTTFIANNPGWPGLRDIERRAEETLGDPVTVTVPAVIVGWFNEHPPLTTSGRMAYAKALKSMGDARATLIAKETWATGSFDRNLEREFLDAFGSEITQQDHRARLDNLLYMENTAEADRMLFRIDEAAAATARARIALITEAGNVDAMVADVPPEFQNEPGLIYDRVKWRRKHDQMDAARAILPQTPDQGARPDLMWNEREILAKDALEHGDIAEAYNIVKNHGELKSAADLADAEWMAGWISLRYLNDGQAALPHFEAVYNTVQYPANVSRGAYWAGRSAAVMGRGDLALEWYKKAALYITTFYGQLALGRLKIEPLPTLSDDPVPTKEERADFEAREITQAMRALADIGDTTYIRAFILAAAEAEDNLVDHVMAAEFADRLGHPERGVILSRQAIHNKVVLMDHGYPVPNYDFPSTPERAFILAIARQESSFDPNARSPAGALGLMQLMPATAKEVARRAKVKHVPSKLISEPAYNLRLGAHFLNSLLERFDGSYLLTAAAYNAGPSRARQWIRDFGDPRDPHVDPVDWVEKIPFPETRNYVQRVMENVMIYRARLANTRNISQNLEAELAARH
jgi:soluble lytic murein transglycosylase